VVPERLSLISTATAIGSAPGPSAARTAEAMGIDIRREDEIEVPPPQKPGEWLEHWPLLTILLALLAAGWLFYEFSRQSAILAISNLNTYNFLFVMVGLLLHLRPQGVFAAGGQARPAPAGWRVRG